MSRRIRRGIFGSGNKLSKTIEKYIAERKPNPKMRRFFSIELKYFA